MVDYSKINWSKVFLVLARKKQDSALKRICFLFERFFGSLMHRSIEPLQDSENNVLCVRSMFRADYDLQWKIILDCIEHEKEVVDIRWVRARGFDGIRRLRFLPRAMRYVKIDSDWINRAIAVIMSLHLFDIQESIQRQKPRSVVFFTEMRPIENFLVQYYQLLGVKTITLQHGLYVEYKDFVTINRVNYEASCADVFLAWGEETCELIKRYNPNAESRKCGVPQLTDEVFRDSLVIERVYIILDADLNVEDNRNLLAIGRGLGKNLDCEVLVKAHPRNDHLLYDFAGLSFVTMGANYESADSIYLGHTTTELIKLAKKNLRVYKYHSSKPCNKGIPEAILFDEVKSLIEKVRSGSGAYPFGWADYHICCVGEESRTAYSNAFSQIL